MTTLTTILPFYTSHLHKPSFTASGNKVLHTAAVFDGRGRNTTKIVIERRLISLNVTCTLKSIPPYVCRSKRRPEQTRSEETSLCGTA